jgi:hypothetical protein
VERTGRKRRTLSTVSGGPPFTKTLDMQAKREVQFEQIYSYRLPLYLLGDIGY